MAQTIRDLRNLALVGHAGSGKTTLTEALLHAAGALRARGSIARGTTASDFDPQEKRLQHSLDATLLACESRGRRLQFVDTPGLADFVGRSLPTLEAVESAVVVVSAVNGVEPSARQMMAYAQERGLARFVVITRIDAPDARPEAVLAELRETFGKECLPLNLPADGGRRVVDCFFQREGEGTDFGAVPAAHEALIDQVVEVDEALMQVYLEQGEVLDLDQLHDAFEKALREGHLVPVCFASGETGAGVPELLEVFARLAPDPTEGNPPPFMKGEGAQAQPVAVVPDPAAHVVGHVFKVVVDPYVGKLGIVRVHQGTLRAGQSLYVGDGRKPIKLAHLYRLQGKETQEIPSAGPGEIVAIAKVDELHFDAVLHDSHDEDHHHLKSVAFPPAMHGLAIEPERRGDEQRIADTLHKLVAEDPCVRLEHHAAQNETVLYGMGELHLRVLLERMAERYGVKVRTHAPSVPYRETITGPAPGHYRHKKQTGGAGQFAEVYLRVEPLPRGTGFEFVDEVVGGAIPHTFIPAVEKGVRQALERGSVAGFALQDVRVVVYDGKHHPVDSKEVAFVEAGKRAFLDAVAQAKPVVLEPIVELEIFAPSTSQGDVAADLATRRGRIGGHESLAGGRVRIAASAPLAELTDYQIRLKSLTGGEGTYALRFGHYDAVPPRRQQELAGAYAARRESAA
ncbi:MAG: elongation factor G [Steroidobacteraceae bacterium]|jgi:elongation factor G|nr:elongation factor G [Steroidobacteraceae bacterium]